VSNLDIEGAKLSLEVEASECGVKHLGDDSSNYAAEESLPA